jgi:hypothetical protein
LDKDGFTRLRVFGDVAFGNREIIFDDAGKEMAAAPLLRGCVVPAGPLARSTRPLDHRRYRLHLGKAPSW